MSDLIPNHDSMLNQLYTGDQECTEEEIDPDEEADQSDVTEDWEEE